MKINSMMERILGYLPFLSLIHLVSFLLIQNILVSEQLKFTLTNHWKNKKWMESCWIWYIIEAIWFTTAEFTRGKDLRIQILDEGYVELLKI